jgi:hypothetical protein
VVQFVEVVVVCRRVIVEAVEMVRRVRRMRRRGLREGILKRIIYTERKCGLPLKEWKLGYR